MAKVCFKNILEENVEFEEIETDSLFTLAHEFAKTKDKELYTTILQKKICVFLNGEELAVDDWGIKLSSSDEVVITPAIEGKASAILQVIVGAILVVAGYITFGTTAWKGAAMMAAGLSSMFGGVSNLLFSPDLPVLPSYSGRGGAETQTYSWSGIKTTAQLDNPIPIVYGTHAVGGNVISLFTEAEGNNNYLYMLLGLCEGEIEGICQEADYTQVCVTSDTTDTNYTPPAIFLDDQPLRNYDEVAWWYRTGTNLPDLSENRYYPFVQNIIPYFPSSRIQFDDGREVSRDWITYTTTKEVDILTLKLEAPALYKVNEDTGDIESATFKYAIEWRKVGGTWAVLTTDKYIPSVTSSTNTNYVVVSYPQSDQKWGVKGGTYKINIINKSEEDSYSSETAPYAATKTSLTKILKMTVDICDANNNIIETKQIEGSYNSITSTVYNLGGNNSTYTTETTIDPSFAIGEYLVKLSYANIDTGSSFTISSIKEGVYSEFTVTGKSKTGIWESKSIDFNVVSDGKGIYEIRIKRTDGGTSSSFYIENTVKLDSVTEVIQGAFIYPCTALLGFRIKATNQLSGSPPNVITVLKGKKVEVPDLQDASPSGSDVTFENCFWSNDNGRWEDYDGAEVYWNDTTSWREEYTENFICCARDLLLNKRYGVGSFIKASNINSVDIITGIKECHREYYPSIDDDFIRWWNLGKDSTWEDNWHPCGSRPSIGEYALAYDSSARYIDIPGTSVTEVDNPYLVFEFKLTRPLVRGQTYTLSLELSDISGGIAEIYPYLHEDIDCKHLSLRVASKENIIVDDTYTWTFTVNKTSSGLTLYFLGNKTFRKLDFRITNLSIVKGVAPTGSTQDVTGVGGKEHFHSFNGVLESDKSALSSFVEMCEGFRCWPTYYGETFSFIMDTDSTPVHTLTTGNTKNFKQSFTPVSEIPCRLVGQYTDESLNFIMRSVMVKTSSTDVNEINEQTLGMKGLTDFSRVARELKNKMDTVENCNHLFEADCDIDSLHCTAGDIIYLQDDLPRWGQGGRILDYTATNITIDKKYVFTNVATDIHLIKFQDDTNTFNTATIDVTHISNDASLQVIPVQSLPASPCTDSTYMLGKSGTDIKKFRIFGVSRGDDNTITVVGRNHVSSLYGSPTFGVVEVSQNKTTSVLDRPLPLKTVLITPLTPFEGKGFNIGVKLDEKDELTKEIVVQLDRTGSTDFETVKTFPVDQRQIKYVDNALKYNQTYTFRVFGRSSLKQSTPITVSTQIKSSFVSVYVSPPSGFCIKDSNASNFNGKDIVLSWNSVGSSNFSTLGILGYKIEIYHTAYNVNNLLRTDYISDTKYTYTLEMNEEDSARLNLAQSNYSVLYFRLYTIAEDNVISNRFTSLTVTNPNPSGVSSLGAESTVGGVNFFWTKSTELDHKYYTYRTKVGNTWGSWKNTENSELNRSLTATEISTAGSKATIHFEVRDVDWYDHESVSASIVASANKISDNIYQLIPSVTGDYSGNVASLYDGVTATGNFIIT